MATTEGLMNTGSEQVLKLEVDKKCGSWLYTASLGISIGSLITPDNADGTLVSLSPFYSRRYGLGLTSTPERQRGQKLLIQNPQFDDTELGITTAVDELLSREEEHSTVTLIGSHALHEALGILRSPGRIGHARPLIDLSTSCLSSMWGI